MLSTKALGAGGIALATSIVAGGIAAAPAAAKSGWFCGISANAWVALDNPFMTQEGLPFTCTRYQQWYNRVEVVSEHNSNNGNGVCWGVTQGTSDFRHMSDAHGLQGYACEGATGGPWAYYPPTSLNGYPFVHNAGHGAETEWYHGFVKYSR